MAKGPKKVAVKAPTPREVPLSDAEVAFLRFLVRQAIAGWQVERRESEAA